VLSTGTYTPGTAAPKGQIPCYDPSTMQFLGCVKAMTPAEVSQVLVWPQLCAATWSSNGPSLIPPYAI